jgi:hypothetical protein
MSKAAPLVSPPCHRLFATCATVFLKKPFPVKELRAVSPLSLTSESEDKHLFFFSKRTFPPTRVRDNGDSRLNTLAGFDFLMKAVAQDPKSVVTLPAKVPVRGSCQLTRQARCRQCRENKRAFRGL